MLASRTASSKGLPRSVRDRVCVTNTRPFCTAIPNRPMSACAMPGEAIPENSNSKGAGAGSEFRNTLLDSFRQIVPPEGSALITKTTGELNARAAIGAGPIWAVIGAAWAILNGTWAMIVGLNKAYGVKEERQWWKISIIAFGLTLSLAILGLIALAIMLYGSRFGTRIGHHLGFHAHPCFLARHSMDGDRNAPPLLFRIALPLRTQLKRSAVEMEYARRRCGNFVVGGFYPAPSSLFALQLFPNCLWRLRCSGYASALAISDERCHCYLRGD